jgi:hypothetical protein
LIGSVIRVQIVASVGQYQHRFTLEQRCQVVQSFDSVGIRNRYASAHFGDVGLAVKVVCVDKWQ